MTSSCQEGEYVTGVNEDGTLACASLQAYVGQNCSVYFGWNDYGRPTDAPPFKVGRASQNECEVDGRNANGTPDGESACVTSEVFGSQVLFMGMTMEGRVDQTDKFYIGFRCN